MANRFVIAIFAIVCGNRYFLMTSAHVTQPLTNSGDDKVKLIDCGRFDNKSSSVENEKAPRHFSKQRHKRQTAIVDVPCQENIDCQTTDGGAYCDTTKRCDCLTAYVNIKGYCWPKRNPGESCLYTDQCNGASHSSYCGTSNICVCSNNQMPTQTDDGAACLIDGECPTNGIYSKLSDSGGRVTRCSDASTDCIDLSRTSAAGDPADAYDCLCPMADAEDADCASAPQSYCCPKRAIVCIQPKDEGYFGFGGGSSQSRWWYNSASSNCESLPYRGVGGNGNNFQSKALCETYCKTACPRGNPIYRPSVDMPRGQVIRRCSATSDCSNDDYYCEISKGTFGMCCHLNKFICSMARDVGDTSYNLRNATRYYFSTDRCVSFVYNGIGGNFNNFQTEAECRAYCSLTVCPDGGEPLRDSGNTVVPCGPGSGGVCPAKYECSSSNVCCPSINFVCSQPQAIGACSSYVERWWFNPTTRSCEKFYYSGCQGNFNNFPTYQTCANRCASSTAKPTCPQGEASKDSSGNYIACSGAGATTNACPADYSCHFDGTRYGCCPTRTKTCSVDGQDPGVLCITPVTRWYYNSQTRLCDVFVYNGCDGNSNNFATKIDCQDYCGVGGCPEGGEPIRDASTGQYRTCGTSGNDCPAGHACNVVTLGTSTRYNYCCPTRASVCSLRQEQGNRCGSNTLNRYFFNSATRTCETFTYDGCGGNRNNFASTDQCLMYCNSAGCPAGQVALQEAGTRRVTTCDAALANGCPTNYKCSFSSVLQQGVCCGSSAASGSCPDGQIAYMDSFTNTPLQCQPNVDNSCPNGIFCRYSPAVSNSFCCNTLTVQCPQGGDPYMDILSSQPRQCTPGLANVCPTGYNCQATTVVVGTITSSTGYCCGQANVCSSGYSPYYINNQPVPCVLNQLPSVCPTPFACRQNLVNGQSYCCTGSTQLAVCAVGKEAYVIQGSPTLCTQISPNTGCPPGYTCDVYPSSGSYYCCRFAAITPTQPPLSGCPSPFVLFQPIRTCSPGVFGTCPNNYFCNWDQVGSRFVCCGAGGVTPTGYCPVNGQPYLNPSTNQPQLCVLGSLATGCPSGYGCSYSQTYRNYYCCSGGGGTGKAQCPAPLTASINQATGQPRTCALGTLTCPMGYQCTRTVTPGVALCCGRGTGGGGDPYGCPTGTAYLYPGTRTPLACTRTSAACPVRYSCLQSTLTSRFQCCSTFGAQAPANGRVINAADKNQNPAMQTSDGRRKCGSNWDCRDKNGKASLCRRGFCMQ